jgi:hypothetical protein
MPDCCGLLRSARTVAVKRPFAPDETSVATLASRPARHATASLNGADKICSGALGGAPCPVMVTVVPGGPASG